MEAEKEARPATAAAEEAMMKKAKRDGVVKEVIRLERESVIPVLKPKLVMKLAYLIGIYPSMIALPLPPACFLVSFALVRSCSGYAAWLHWPWMGWIDRHRRLSWEEDKRSNITGFFGRVQRMR